MSAPRPISGRAESRSRQPRMHGGGASLTVNAADPHVLQQFLAVRLGLSRRAAKAAVDSRSVWVNRRCVWIATYAVKTGDTVEMFAPVVKRPAKTHVRVLWSDEAYLVCDKPAGIVSCDDPKSVEATLRVQERIPTLEAVHRLDRDTSGCLLFAKNHAAYLAAVEVFKTHRVSKLYHAITAGTFRYSYLLINAPLDGQEAVSKVNREAYSADASFLRVRIETGRTNQIRRHLASVRAPVLGDRVFGLKSARDPRLMRVPRQMLHASTLALPNPLKKSEEIKVHSPLPADFRETLRLFSMGRKGGR